MMCVKAVSTLRRSVQHHVRRVQTEIAELAVSWKDAGRPSAGTASSVGAVVEPSKPMIAIRTECCVTRAGVRLVRHRPAKLVTMHKIARVCVTPFVR